MRRFFLSFVICLFSSIAILAQDVSKNERENKVVAEETIELNWESSFKSAIKKSKKEKKPILIYFTGSDWCSPCKILDKKLFHTQRFKDIADKDLVLYEANDPRNKDLVTPKQLEVTNDLKNKYNVRSFPTLVFINDKGNMIGYKKGLILTDYYYPFIESVIENY